MWYIFCSFFFLNTLLTYHFFIDLWGHSSKILRALTLSVCSKGVQIQMSKSMTTYYKTNNTMWHSRWYSSDIWNTAKPHQNLAKTPPKPHQNIAFPAQNLTKTSHKTSKTSQKPYQNVAFLYSVPKGHQNLTKTSPKPHQNLAKTSMEPHKYMM